MKIDIPFDVDWTHDPETDTYRLEIGPYTAEATVRPGYTVYWVVLTGVGVILQSRCRGSDRETEVEEAQKSCEDAVRDDVTVGKLAAAGHA